MKGIELTRGEMKPSIVEMLNLAVETYEEQEPYQQYSVVDDIYAHSPSTISHYGSE